MQKRDKKIIQYEALQKHKVEWKNKKTVLVGGCFDILHFGHLVFLDKAKQAGETLIIALESDEFIQKRKKRKAVHTQMQRAHLLAALDIVDYVILLPLLKTDQEYGELVEYVEPKIIAVTAGDRYLDHKRQQAQKVGATVQEVAPLLENLSSNQIINYASIFSD